MKQQDSFGLTTSTFFLTWKLRQRKGIDRDGLKSNAYVSLTVPTPCSPPVGSRKALACLRDPFQISKHLQEMQRLKLGKKTLCAFEWPKGIACPIHPLIHHGHQPRLLSLLLQRQCLLLPPSLSAPPTICVLYAPAQQLYGHFFRIWGAAGRGEMPKQDSLPQTLRIIRTFRPTGENL